MYIQQKKQNNPKWQHKGIDVKFLSKIIEGVFCRISISKCKWRIAFAFKIELFFPLVHRCSQGYLFWMVWLTCTLLAHKYQVYELFCLNTKENKNDCDRSPTSQNGEEIYAWMVDHTDEKSITEEKVHFTVYLLETSSKQSLI